jgi:hypothetical protein
MYGGEPLWFSTMGQKLAILVLGLYVILLLRSKMRKKGDKKK